MDIFCGRYEILVADMVVADMVCGRYRRNSSGASGGCSCANGASGTCGLFYIRPVPQLILTNSNHSRPLAHIKGRTAVLLDYVMPVSATHDRHEASLTLQYSLTYFSMTRSRQKSGLSRVLPIPAF